MKYFLWILLVFAAFTCFAQPANDNCAAATVITNVQNFCSADAAYTNVGATSSGLSQGSQWNASSPGNDVWFTFTAIARDVSISIIGNQPGGGTTGGTMVLPLGVIYRTDDCTNFAEQTGSTVKQGNTTILYAGGLVIGKQYYLRVSADNNNTGTFKLCINNFNQTVKAGQDCATATVLCSKDTFTEFNVGGAGNSNTEVAGTCVEERNSAWYKWTAANNGTLTFTITPASPDDDIDWVLYDLGTVDNCNLAGLTPIRCVAGHNLTCPNEPQYYKTGMNLTETDLNEAVGCGQGQNGFVRYLDMQQGHIYALLVDNFSNPNNSFTIEFGGSGQFKGPDAGMTVRVNDPCTVNQSYTFTNTSVDYTGLEWNFGDGASIATSTQAGPHTVTYSTPGVKTVTLKALGNLNCFTLVSETFTVAVKPQPPPISIDKPDHCLGETFTLSTPPQPGATYSWTGPGGFTASTASISVTATTQAQAGTYRLSISLNGCTSDPSSFTVPAFGTAPSSSFTIITQSPCTPQHSYTFVSTSTNFTGLEWDFGDGASTATSTLAGPHTITYSTAGVKTVTLRAIGTQNCAATSSLSFTFSFQPPVPLISIDKPEHCIGETFALSTPQQIGASYAWTGPAGFTANTPSISVLASDQTYAGTYQLRVTIGNCTSDPASYVVPPFGTMPLSDFTISNNAACTFQQSFTFTNASSNAQQYRWNFGAGASIPNATTSGPFTVTYSSPGQKTITLETVGSAGCIHVTQKTINVPAPLATPQISVNKPAFCLTDMIRFSTPVTDGVTYRWTGPNNFSSDQASFEISAANPAVAGTYILVVSNASCDSEPASITIPPILDLPVAEFRTDPPMPAKLSFPVTVTFFNDSRNADSFLWDFGDGNTSTDRNPQHTYNSRGTFEVTLTAWNKMACSASVTRAEFILIQGSSIYIPNTFTPNGDGINDRFVINITNLRKYQLYIYNRYGELVFGSTDVFESWDGNYQGQALPLGTYYYVISAVNLDDESIKRSGSVTIIR